MFSFTGSGATQALAALDLHAAHSLDLSARLDEASDFVYEATRHRFDAEGEGEWPELTESTVAKKESQGYAEPARPLYATGNLYESATSPNGPYSTRIHVKSGIGLASTESVVMLVDFDSNGWQIPSVLAEGTEKGLPARPIWPPAHLVQDQVGEILMRGI
jgi:hypothetical protein